MLSVQEAHHLKPVLQWIPKNLLTIVYKNTNSHQYLNSQKRIGRLTMAQMRVSGMIYYGVP